jgi:hypothetical protein
VDNVCAACTAGTWVTQTAGTTWDVAGGSMKALTLDPQGGVHITYYEEPDALMHAYKPQGGSWVQEQVAVSVLDPLTGVVVDSQLRVHIVFEGSGNSLVYATRPAGGAWTQQSLSLDSTYHGLALDALGVLHLSYVTGDTLMYAQRPPGGSFTSETADPAALAGDNAIAVDGEGTVHVCYQDTTDNALKHAARSSSGVWTTETVDSPGNVGEACSIGASAAGDVVIAYSELPATPGWNIKYARRPKGGSWAVELLGSSGNNVGAPSVASDGSDRVVFEYYNYGGSIRYYRRPSGGSWTNEVAVGSEAQLNGPRSMATDSAGGVHLAYQDYGGNVKYAYRCP